MARIVRNDGNRIEVYQPRVANDTVFGFATKPIRGLEGKLISVPVSDIRSVEIMRFNAGQTILLVAGIGATIFLVAALIDLANADWFKDGNGGNDTTSCPTIYSWDGHHWRLDSGTYGGAVVPALQRTDIDNLIYAVPEGGALRLRLAGVPGETEYVDALSLLAVDHPRGVEVLPDAAGSPALHSVGRPMPPMAARDDRGRDILSWIGVSDGMAWESAITERDPGAGRDGVDLWFARPAGRDTVKLVLEAQNTPWAAHLMRHLARAYGREVERWYAPATADDAGRLMAPIVDQEAALRVQVYSQSAWQTRGYVREIGPEIPKRVALPLDLSGVQGDTIQVRLESMPNVWRVDYTGIDTSTDLRLAVQPLGLHQALRDGSDVRDLLRVEDHQYLVLNQGDVVELLVDVPADATGLARSYLARTTGWYRLHAAEGLEPDTVFLSAVDREGASAVAVEMANRALNAQR